MALADANNAKSGVAPRQQKIGSFSSSFKTGQESNFDRAKNSNMSTLPVASGLKANHYKNQRMQPGLLQNLPNKTSNSISHAAPASQVISPQHSPKAA